METLDFVGCIVALVSFAVFVLLTIGYFFYTMYKKYVNSTYATDFDFSDVDASATAPPERWPDVEISKEFWLSEKKVLHNSLCRWYKKSNGRVWDGISEYSNCGSCGGHEPIIHVRDLPEYKEWKEAQKDTSESPSGSSSGGHESVIRTLNLPEYKEWREAQKDASPDSQ